METREHTQANLSLLRERLGSGRVRSAQMLIGSLHPSEVARLLDTVKRPAAQGGTWHLGADLTIIKERPDL